MNPVRGYLGERDPVARDELACLGGVRVGGRRKAGDGAGFRYRARLGGGGGNRQTLCHCPSHELLSSTVRQHLLDSVYRAFHR